MYDRHTKPEATMRQSITMRLDPSILSAAKVRAKAKNRTLTNYVETLLMRDLIDQGDTGKTTVFAPEGTHDASDVSAHASTAENFERSFLLSIYKEDGSAAEDMLKAGRPIHIRRDDTPPGHVIRIHPNGLEELVHIDINYAKRQLSER
jgi:hypothetical protein